jgi:hypothetical protein
MQYYMDRFQQMQQIHASALSVFKKKNTDYGDSFATYGTIGVLVRIGDKIQRLLQVSKTGINLVEDESLRDTLLDLHNYSALALMTLDDEGESCLFQQNTRRNTESIPEENERAFNKYIEPQIDEVD